MQNLRLPLLICVFLTLSINVKDSYSGLPPIDLESGTSEYIDKEIRKIIRKHKLPAFAITIVDDQNTVYQEARGFIDIGNNIPATTESVFKLWSLAKVFTAIEIFRELEEGLIELDSPVTTYLPEFSVKSRFVGDREITVKDILAHRSGLPRHEGLLPEGIVNEYGWLEKFETGASNVNLAYPVGYRYKYSNLGYDLLGRIIEQTRKTGYYQYMKESVLNDLGLYNSNFYLEGFSDPLKIAKGYEYHKGRYHPLIQYNINNVPSGNLYSTIEDLSLFLKAIFRNREFKNEETISQMFIDYYSKPEDPETMGLGWKTARIENNELLIWHDGGPTEGIGSLVAFLPERKIGIAMIGNSTSFSGAYSLQFAIDIFNHLLNENEENIQTRSDGPDNRTVGDEHLKRLEGKYVTFGSIMRIRAKKNMLRARIGGLGLSLIPVNENDFAVTNWMEKTGLTKIFRPPMDFNKIRISFKNENSVDSCYMIIDLGNISYELCQRYPVKDRVPDSWNNLVGDYRVAELTQDNTQGNVTDRMASISLDDNVLLMSGVYGPVLPINDTTIIIVGGPFAGETMDYFPDSGNIIYHKTLFEPERE